MEITLGIHPIKQRYQKPKVTVWFKIILSPLCFPCYLKLRQEFTFLQLIHYYRIGTHYSYFLDRPQLLVQKLLQQSYVAPSLRNIHFSNGNRPFPFYADIYRTWLWATLRYLIGNKNYLPFVSPWVHHRFFGAVRVAHRFSLCGVVLGFFLSSCLFSVSLGSSFVITP
jgi:hypothetical protein